MRVTWDYPPEKQWLNLDRNRDEKPEGFYFRMFLIPRDGDKGVLCDGKIHIEMKRRVAQPDGSTHYEFVDSWTYKTSELTHSKKPTALGYYYVPILTWLPHDVAGEEIEFIVIYEHPDGQEVGTTRPIRLKVPRKVF